MISKIITSALSLAWIAIVFPLAAKAEEYHLLVPDGALPGITPASTKDAGTLVQSLFDLGIGVAVVLAVVMIIIGGIKYMMTGSITGTNDAKDTIKSAIGGLLLALVAVILLSTINSQLISLDFASSLRDLVDQAKPAATPPGSPPVTPPPGEVGWQSDANERAALEEGMGGKISFNNKNCAYVGQVNCTSMSGLSQKAIDGIRNLASVKGCNCPIQINAGTEYWLHSAKTQHRPGNSVVDLDPSTRLNQYIARGGSGANPADGYENTVGGVKYVFEVKGGNSTGDHWHVTF